LQGTRSCGDVAEGDLPACTAMQATIMQVGPAVDAVKLCMGMGPPAWSLWMLVGLV
jgi:hypothetical protein